MPARRKYRGRTTMVWIPIAGNGNGPHSGYQRIPVARVKRPKILQETSVKEEQEE